MSARRQPQPPPVTPPTISPRQAIQLLRGQCEKAASGAVHDSASGQAWVNTTREYILQAFGQGSENVNAFVYARSSNRRFVNEPPDVIARNFQADLAAKVKIVESCIEQLEARASLEPVAVTTAPSSISTGKVFVVHGHNEAVKQTVARVLEKLDLTPIILHEQANQGHTLIEKFEHHADVGFAIVLMTADDLGRSKEDSDLNARARQNVVFEWGFFIGKLGRKRVCALYEPGVEAPSDMNGFVYTPLDAAGHWQLALGRELKAAGYDIDLNKLV